MTENPHNLPVQQKDRVVGLDVLRGLAIFGILVVNVEQMFLPLFLADAPAPMIPGEWGSVLTWSVTDALFRNKFLTIFSLLFGAGFCLQWLRRREDGRAFRRLYLRRLGVLALFGIAHAVFFYMADVLVIYALTALGLFALKNVSGRWLLRLGGALFAATVAWYGFISGPGRDDAELPEKHLAVAEEIARMRPSGTVRIDAVELGPFRRLDFREEIHRDTSAVEGGAEVLDDGRVRLEESVYRMPMPKWLAILILDGRQGEQRARVEYAVYSHGPPAATIFARFSFLLPLLILYTPFYLGWRTLALLMIGAGCVKSGWLEPSKRSAWKRVAIAGVGVGLPITLTATALRVMAYTSPGRLTYAGNLLQEVSSLLLAAGIAGLVFLWCSGKAGGRLERGLSSVGRTALTNYIGQSVVMSLVATSYGLGLFGDLSRLQIFSLAVVCFAGQLFVSSWWLRHFRMGPLEWSWRCLTYWKKVPLAR